MKISFTLAYKNIAGHIRKTILTIILIALSLALTVFLIGFLYGYLTDSITRVTKIFTGEFQITAKGYKLNKDLDLLIRNPDIIMKEIKVLKNVEHLTPRIEVPSLISSEENTFGLLLLGINPETEYKVSSIRNSIVQGSVLANGDNKGILIGEKLSKRLNVGLNKEVAVILQAADGSTGTELYTVKGIYNTSIPDLDASVGFITIDAAREIAVIPDGVTIVIGTVDNYRMTEQVIEQIKTKPFMNNLAIESWAELLPDQKGLADLSEGFIYLGLVIVIVIIIIIEIVSTLSSIYDRMQEFGVMLALGIKPKNVTALLVKESLIISFIGTFAGLLLGMILLFLFNEIGIPMNENTVIFTELQPGMNLTVSFIILLMPVLASIYPGIKASKFSPIKILRKV